MPRKPRLSPLGTFNHIMARGIEGRDIFLDDDDRRKFLEYLAFGLQKTGFKCYAWVLMGNHYHLLVRTNEKHLSELMRRLNASYAQYYSKKYKRRGYLFQDRFKSQVTQDQKYVEELVRYIHLNPVRAGMCHSLKVLDKYPWSGHAVLMGNAPGEFQDTWTVLRRFGGNFVHGRQGYASFMREGIHKGKMETFASLNHNNPASYVIGDPEFVKAALAAEDAKKMMLPRWRKEGLGIGDIAEKVSKAAGLKVEELLVRSRGTWKSDIRKIFAYVCYREYGMKIIEITRYLGIAHSAGSIAVGQGEEIVKRPRYANILIALRP